MILGVFCVRDRATDQFGNPMFLVNTGQAIRSFSDEVNRAAEDNMMYKHSDDFDLYHLGSYDTSNGQFTVGNPAQIAVGKMVRIQS